MIDVLKEASQILLDANNIEENTEKKSERNFVTIYDKNTQAFIKEKLNTFFPDIKFIGEENNCSNENPYENRCFICDPIDGTANFRRKYNHSAISLAYAENGEVISGVVINPYLNEIFYAERNKGAFLNGNKIKVSENHLNSAFVAFGTSPYYPELIKKTGQLIGKILTECEDIRRAGTAALDLCYIACGRHDFFFELSLFPWDYAASMIIIEEAGGIITNRNGDIPPLDKRSEIFAGNKFSYKDFFSKDYLK